MLASTFATTHSVLAWTLDDKVYDDFGPRVDTMVWNIYQDTDTLMLALQAGAVDVADWEVPKAYGDKWATTSPWNDPANGQYIKMGSASSIGMREFDLNHKAEIDTYPGVPNPTSYTAMRQAIAYLSNKPEYVAQILGGEGVVMDTPLMPWTFWYNHACDNYYAFSLASARAALTAGGFTTGSTPPLVPGGDNVRIHPGTGLDLQPLILYIRADDPFRMEAGKRVAALLKTVGVPTQDNILPMSGCYNPVFTYQDYNLYTGGWSLSNDPDYLYDLWGGHAINWPNYDYYDSAAYNEAAARIKYPTTLAEALQGAMDAQWIFTQEVGFIPLWTSVARTAHRGYANSNPAKPWEGFVNASGVGVANGQSYINAHAGAETGGTLIAGQKEKPLKLNIMRSEWYFEYSVLDRIYDSLLGADPYTFENGPWLAHSWYVGTYYNNALKKEATMLTFNLEDDIYWHDGVHFTSADVKFTIDYYKAHQGWNWGAVMDVFDVQTPDDYTVVVLMSVKSYWALNWIGLGVPMMPKHIWETIDTDAEIDVPMPDPLLIGTGPFKYGGGETGSEPGTGVVPQQYVIMPAFNPSSPGYFRHCPLTAAGGINTQGNYALPAKSIMRRDVFGPKDINGVLKHASLNAIVPIITAKNLHAPYPHEASQSITWTLTATGGYSDSEIITVVAQGAPVTMTFTTIDISAAANGALGYTFSATHTQDLNTTRTCTWSRTGLIKTFLGDIDGNNALNLYDALELSSGFSLWSAGGTYYANADISGDGLVDSFDAIEMAFYLG